MDKVIDFLRNTLISIDDARDECSVEMHALGSTLIALVLMLAYDWVGWPSIVFLYGAYYWGARDTDS